MTIHKLIHKHEHSAVKWLHHENYTHLAEQLHGKWEIFAQKCFTIQPKSRLTLSLGIGVQLMRGVCSVSLRQALKEKRCSLQDGFVAESVNDIIVTIHNNSDVAVNIVEGESLCFVAHQA
jgi:hypothetical protein